MKILQCTALLLALCIRSADGAEFSRWGYFSFAYRSGFVRVDVSEAFGANGYWVLRRTTAEGPPLGVQKSSWADSRTCPAVTDSMNKLNDVEFPVFATPNSLERLRKRGPDSGELTVVSDPNIYELEYSGFYHLRGAHATASILAYDDSPLAQWVNDTLKRLESCWTDKEVR